ncbi:hypothetical protein RHMOL_Rhmol09G0161500 [Rhododendron molle]|uniref:Uncharacterized protein n=1 Tax=Rhododendron molle TaxID=49168 RepID=A0ACC0ME16_RHOML|nr:hypothetical protein RHMOL_Rhmol09G0161500 [Rhododendron molle]
MEVKTDPSFEADDDVFYAELRRQILLLTLEDDDENAVFPKTRRLDARGGAKQGSGSGVPSVRLLPGSCFGWLENENSTAVPTWLVNLWRHGNGTGVFIPHIAKSRRRPKSDINFLSYIKQLHYLIAAQSGFAERRNNARGRIYKPVANENE